MEGTTSLVAQIEETIEWIAARWGWSPTPRSLRAAVRNLDSDYLPTRQRAEASLRADRRRAAPLLRQAVSAKVPVTRAVRAALLLHGLQEQEGAALLRHMAHEEHLRTGEGGDLLRQALREIVGPEHYLRQAVAALTRLEQMPESFASITRFRQALQILRFLDTPLPSDLLRRGLVVRTVGGENLSLVRSVLEDAQGVSLEHVCMARKEVVETILHLKDRHKAYKLLAHNLAHPSPTVKLTAMYGLERLGDPRAIGPLMRIANDMDSPVRDEARRLVEMLNFGTPDVMTLLRPVGAEADPAADLLRPALERADSSPETLLRPL